MTDPYAPRFEVRISGLTLASDVTNQATSLSVETNLDLAGAFGINLYNPDNTVLDSPLFDLGKTVEIHLGYGRDLKPAFLGEITAIAPSFPGDGAPTVTITGYDKSYKMRRSQPEPTEHTFVNDSEIAADIAVANGLVPIVDPTSGMHEKIIQAESDMAFLKSRADDHFMDVYVEWDRLHFQYPRPQTTVHVLEWGRTLSSFTPRISSAGLAGIEVVRDYNQELAQTIFGMALAVDFDPHNLLERLGSSAMDLLTAMVRKKILRNKIENPVDAVVVAKALLANLLEGMYEGSGSCIGIPDLTAGNYVEIRGVGTRFGGTYRARKVAHHIDANGFRTDFEISQRAHTSLLSSLRDHISDEPSPNKADRFFGVTVATVVDNNETTAKPPTTPIGRVKLSYPGLSSSVTSGWAPCARPMAGSNIGFYALPEPGEQVLVAFEKGDLGHPYVLGSLWHAKARPPTTNADGQNNKRIIRSRAGHTITFDDTGNVGKLVIEDRGGSSIVMDATDGSITITARADLRLAAKNAISLQVGGTKLTVSPQDVNIT